MGFEMGDQQHEVEEADHQIKKRFECIREDSDDSSLSSSSSTVTDLMEDATSSCSSSSLNGPLYELSTGLMDNLPLKRGLSRYYEGKSQSFTSLTSVRSLEDLAKEEHPYNKRMRLSRSYGGGSDDHDRRNKRFCNPKPAIVAMKACSRGS